MATFVNGILGGFSGKVGTVVGATWKGIDYMRSLAASITNPRTQAQLEQRAKFTLIIAFLRTLTAFLRISWKSAAMKMSAFNAAMAYNVKHGITGVYPNYTLDYANILLSRGALAGALNPVLASVTAGQVDVTWDDNSDQSNALDDDQVFLVVYNPTTKKSITLMGGSTRQAKADSISLPDSFTGEEVCVYVGFATADESEVSDSTYAGKIVVA